MTGYEIVAKIDASIRRHRAHYHNSQPTKIELRLDDAQAIVRSYGRPPGATSPDAVPEKLFDVPVKVTPNAPRGGRVLFESKTTTTKGGRA